MSENNENIFELGEINNEENLFKRVPVAVFNSPIWLNEQEFSRKEAFMDLYSLAFDSYYNDSRVIPIRETFTRIYSGQVAMGLRTLASRWQWSTKKVNNFLKKLEEYGFINIIKRHPVTIFYLVDFVHRKKKIRNTKETNVLQAVDTLDT